MRILFFSNVFPNPLYPAKGTFNLSFARALAGKHSVHVVSPVSWTDELSASARQGKRVLGRQMLADNLTAEFPRFWYPPKILRSRYGDFLDWSVRPTLNRVFDEYQPDAVISYWVHPDGEVAVNTANRFGVPAVVMTGGSDVLLLGRNGRRRQVIVDVLNRADAVVPVSRDIARVLVNDGIDSRKIHVIYRGVDRQIFCPGDRTEARRRLNLSADRRILVAVGRLVPVKGFDVLISACRQLGSRGLPVECHILGGGPLQRKLADQISGEWLSGHVFLHGSQKQSELAAWYRAADLTVLSSHSEGIPNVLMESLSCGTPFVATNVGGVSEIADERIHSLVPPNNPAALADAIELRLKSLPTETARPTFTPSSWADSADSLCRVIEACQRSLRETSAAISKPAPHTISQKLQEVST